jgi:PAS domain S-box-containing protein
MVERTITASLWLVAIWPTPEATIGATPARLSGSRRQAPAPDLGALRWHAAVSSSWDAGENEVNFETFARELQAVRARGDQFRERALEAVTSEALLPAALEELSTVLEELRVTEEEVLAQQDRLAESWQTAEADREHYRELFLAAPAAYLVTDRVGVIREANRRAADLLGVSERFLVGRPLAMFAAAEDRWDLRDRLNRPDRLEAGSWRVRLRPRRQEPLPVAVSASVVRNPDGEVTGLRWLLLELPRAGEAAAPGPPASPAGSPSLLAELVGSQPDGPAVAAATAAPDWDNLAKALDRMVQAAVPLLRADGTGLMLADRDGTLHVVTGSDQAEQTFERAERDLDEGPCIDAFATGQVVWTADLWADPRWPRLGPAARTNKIRGVLSAPVLQDGRAVGTCNALAFSPRAWTDGDVSAIQAYADMLGQLIGSVSDARHKGELAAQLQLALDSRVLIEQAKGVLMERHGLDDQAAFTRLRKMARSSARKLPEVAREVIANRPG